MVAVKNVVLLLAPLAVYAATQQPGDGGLLHGDPTTPNLPAKQGAQPRGWDVKVLNDLDRRVELVHDPEQRRSEAVEKRGVRFRHYQRLSSFGRRGLVGNSHQQHDHDAPQGRKSQERGQGSGLQTGKVLSIYEARQRGQGSGLQTSKVIPAPEFLQEGEYEKNRPRVRQQEKKVAARDQRDDGLDEVRRQLGRPAPGGNAKRSFGPGITYSNNPTQQPPRQPLYLNPAAVAQGGLPQQQWKARRDERTQARPFTA